MRDESKPDALRAGMAKAVLPYLHRAARSEERGRARGQPEPMSDLELARRIAHILDARERTGETRAKAEPASYAVDAMR